VAVDLSITVSFKVGVKTLARVDKQAIEWDLSRANTLLKLVESALMHVGEPVECSAITNEGERRKDGVAVTMNNEARRLL
jgi:hypothetical protein